VNALVEKDVRLLRPVLLALAALAALLLFVLPAAQYVRARYAPADEEAPVIYFTRPTPSQAAQDALTKGTLWLFPAELIGLAAAGGMAFALERRERWAEFLALLPVSRRRVVWTKLAATLGVWLLLIGTTASACVLSDRSNDSSYRSSWWARAEHASFVRQGYVKIALVGLAVAWLLRHRGRGGRWGGAALACLFVLAVWRAWNLLAYQWAGGWYGGRWSDLPPVAATLHALPLAVAVFGLAWLLSSLTRSAALSAMIGLGLPLAAMVWVWNLPAPGMRPGPNAPTAEFRAYREPAERFENRCEAFTAAAGLACVAAGVAVQTRRVSP
jgi:hypothetical protein